MPGTAPNRHRGAGARNTRPDTTIATESWPSLKLDDLALSGPCPLIVKNPPERPDFVGTCGDQLGMLAMQDTTHSAQVIQCATTRISQ